MNILFITSEASPFAKTGGLGDVCGSLPKEIAKAGAETAVMMPLYETIPSDCREKMEFLGYTYIRLAWRSLYCGILRLCHDGVNYYFLDNEYYFKRRELYGHYDDGERFAFLCKAAVECMFEIGRIPDVIHLNDWQTALVPAYLLESPREEARGIRTVFTIHNIEYQGRFGYEILSDVLGLPERYYNEGTLEFMGGVSFMKAGLMLSDRITTVSPTYAGELKYAYYTHGLEGVISANESKLSGILNGIDQEVFNPETDPHLIKNFSVETRNRKIYNKLGLQRLLRLEENESVPVIAMVSRLVRHKGLDLVAAALDRMVELGAQLVFLGRGERQYEQLLEDAQIKYAGRISASILYSNELAMKIYAGADMFLMPSQTEPCGLSQMIAMRYGTIPIVRETGGLNDTVRAFVRETGQGNGFTFANFNADDMLYVVAQACKVYQEKAVWDALIKKNMETDFGWSKSAQAYLKIYRDLLGS